MIDYNVLDDGVAFTVNLPRSLEWVNRFKSRVRQDIRFTLGGSFIVQESSVKAGNEVTLSSGPNVFVEYGILKTLLAESENLGKTYTLTFPDEEVISVKFKHPDPISATPVLRCDTYADTDNFNNVTINFYRVDEQ